MMSRNFTLSILTFLFSFFLKSYNTQSSSSFPQAIIDEMASRETRYHHYLWHNIRDNWNRLSSSTQAEITRLGWAPPRPSRQYDSEGNSVAIPDNNSGEDFLYMHRQMMTKVKAIIARNGGSIDVVTGWKTLPAPGDPTWPVPPAYTIPGSSSTTSSTTTRKSASFYTNTIKPLEETFTDPVELREMTLGELGTRIEVTIHNYLHMRFSSRSSYGYRPSASTLPDIDEKWDDPRYNWLGDRYSSQVNPIFWKIHGWVDDRIEDWRRANGLSSIRWKGTWEGGPMSTIEDLWDSKQTSLRVPGDQNEGKPGVGKVGDTMQEVFRIFQKEGIESNFSDLIDIGASIDLKSGPKSKRRLCRSKSSK